MSAHTPGPWIVERPFGEDGTYISGPNTGLVAKLYSPDTNWGNINANAALIAAAPDMLEALIALVRMVQDPCGMPSGAIATAYQHAQAAITKANGGAR